MSNSKPASPHKSKGNRPIYRNNLYYVADPSNENLTFDNESQNVYNTFQSQRNSLIQDNSQMFVQSMNLYQKDDFQRNRQKTNIRCVTPFIQTYVRDNGNNLKYNLPPTELKNDFKNINEVKKGQNQENLINTINNFCFPITKSVSPKVKIASKINYPKSSLDTFENKESAQNNKNLEAVGIQKPQLIKNNKQIMMIRTPITQHRNKVRKLET